MRNEDSHEQVLRQIAKKAIRTQMLQLRTALSVAARAERSYRIEARLKELHVVRQGSSFALFWPIEAKGEVDLRALDAYLRLLGKEIVYPTLEVRTGTPALARVNHPTELALRGHGFLEPPKEAPLVQSVDVVFVPGFAFDPSGHRIGYGSGFYDRLLASLPSSTERIGVAFDFQWIPEVGVSAGDVPVDRVVTDLRMLVCEERTKNPIKKFATTVV